MQRLMENLPNRETFWGSKVDLLASFSNSSNIGEALCPTHGCVDQMRSLKVLTHIPEYNQIRGGIKNIARGTTDPEIDSVTWTKFGNNMAPLALVANLATRWRHLQ